MVTVSCSDDDNDIDNDLVGSWEMTESDEEYEYKTTITFNSNGTGVVVSVETYEGETDTYNDNFTWGTEGDQLTVVLDGQTETITYSISGNKLTLLDEFGSSVFTKK